MDDGDVEVVLTLRVLVVDEWGDRGEGRARAVGVYWTAAYPWDSSVGSYRGLAVEYVGIDQGRTHASWGHDHPSHMRVFLKGQLLVPRDPETYARASVAVRAELGYMSIFTDGRIGRMDGWRLTVGASVGW